MANSDLAHLSDQLVLGAVLLYAAAMAGYALDLGFGVRRRAAVAEQSKVLVGVGGAGSPAPGQAEEGQTPERSERDWGRFAVLLSVLGWALHLGALVSRGVAAERWPWGNMYEFLVAISFSAVTGYLVVLWRYRARYLGAFVMVAAAVALGVATIWVYTPVGDLSPALQSYWIAIHVTAAITATGSFCVAGAATAAYLLKQRRPAGMLDRLPSLEVLDGLAYKVTLFAFPIWTFAIVAGAIWADDAWGRYWNWDPKEIWSFVTWTIYAGYLHARATAGWQGRKAALIALVGFAALLFNFFGVNYLFSGMHSYAG